MKKIALNKQALPKSWILGYDRLEEESVFTASVLRRITNDPALIVPFVQAMFKRGCIPWTISFDQLVHTIKDAVKNEDEFNSIVKKTFSYQTSDYSPDNLRLSRQFSSMLTNIFTVPQARSAVIKLCASCIGYAQVEGELTKSYDWGGAMSVSSGISFYLGSFQLAKQGPYRPVLRVHIGAPLCPNARVLIGAIAESIQCQVEKLNGLHADRLIRLSLGSLLMFDRDNLAKKLGYVRADKAGMGLSWELFYPDLSCFDPDKINHDINLVLDHAWSQLKPLILRAEERATAKIVAFDLASV